MFGIKLKVFEDFKMSRKPPKTNDNVITLPEIIDIEVSRQESSINFKPLENKQKGKKDMVKLVKKRRARERKEEEEDCDPQTGENERTEQEKDSGEPRDGDVAGAVDPKDKK